MFAEIIHVNGTFDMAKREHVLPDDRTAYFERISKVAKRLTDGGLGVIYKPNYGADIAAVVNDNSEAALALETDPFLRVHGGTEDLTVMPDGVSKPLDLVVSHARVEDDFMKCYGRAVLFGAYTTECVIFSAYNLHSRHPRFDVAIDAGLSIQRLPWSGVPVTHTADISHLSVESWLDKQLPPNTDTGPITPA